MRLHFHWRPEIVDFTIKENGNLEQLGSEYGFFTCYLPTTEITLVPLELTTIIVKKYADIEYYI